MKGNVLTSTTNSIEGASIEKYIELVSVNVVVGTNIFSDFGASFTDFFGGLSDTYQNKLEKIYKIGVDKLKLKANRIGANAILGIKIDFDEISGKGKSMFMISVIGTAVKINYKSNKQDQSKKIADSIVDYQTLEKEVAKHHIIDKINTEKLPSQDDWIYLLNFPILEISDKILNLYLANYNKVGNQLTSRENILLTNTPAYFKILDENHSKRVLYSILLERSIPIVELIISNNLFSPSGIIELIKKGKIESALECLKADKNYYSSDDLLLMKEIVSLLDNLKDLGRIGTVKNILGQTKEKYICPDGHHNAKDLEYCYNFECGKNIKGLTHTKVDDIKQFKQKVESLSSILNTK